MAVPVPVIPARTFVVGPQIPPNTYSYQSDFDFSNPKFVHVGRFLHEASEGQMHEDVVACAAQLAKEGKIKFIGNGRGFKVGVKHFADAQTAAQNYKTQNVGVDQPKFVRVEDLLAIAGDSGNVFLDAVPVARKATYDRRIQKFDVEYYLSRWTFPIIPAGKTDLLKDKPARIAREQKEQDDQQRRNRDQNDSENDDIDEPIIYSDSDDNDNDDDGKRQASVDIFFFFLRERYC